MYYTDYPHAKDWRDVWSIVWRYRIETASKRVKVRVEERETETDAFAGAAVEDPQGPKVTHCLLIADFGTSRAAKEAEKAVIGKTVTEYRARYRLAPPDVQRLTIKPHYFQVQFDLGRFPISFYSSGADYAAAVGDACKRYRGTLHFDDRPS
jgi:hypothetical protein